MRIEFTPEAAKGVEWDDIEIHPIREEKDMKGQTFCEQCEPGEEDFWSVYLHLVEGGLTCIADLPSKKDAESLQYLLLYLTENSKRNEKRQVGKRK